MGEVVRFPVARRQEQIDAETADRWASVAELAPAVLAGYVAAPGWFAVRIRPTTMGDANG